MYVHPVPLTQRPDGRFWRGGFYENHPPILHDQVVLQVQHGAAHKSPINGLEQSLDLDLHDELGVVVLGLLGFSASSRCSRSSASTSCPGRRRSQRQTEFLARRREAEHGIARLL